MRLRTDTGLCSKGGAGGLFLESGSGPTFLPLPASILQQIAVGNQIPGVTTLRMPQQQQQQQQNESTIQSQSKEIDIEVCFVCKKCRIAFATESLLLQHQRQCYSGNQENRGAFRIVQTGHECKTCSPPERFKTIQDFKKHCETELHLNNNTNNLNLKQVNLNLNLTKVSESPLSHEMEDVVNQITLLAARAAQESVTTTGGGGGGDTTTTNNATSKNESGKMVLSCLLPPPQEVNSQQTLTSSAGN